MPKIGWELGAGSEQVDRSCLLPLTSYLLFFVLIFMCFSSPALAMDDEMSEYSAEQKAREAHELASTDMIYQQEEWKALYYQNIQIIKLLREIRDLMQNQNERAAKADQKS